MKGMNALSELSKASKEAKSKVFDAEEIELNISPENHPLVRKQREEIKLLNSRISILEASLEKKNSEVKSLEKKVSSRNAVKQPTHNKSDEMLVFRTKELQSVYASKMINAIKAEKTIQKKNIINLPRKVMIDTYDINESKITLTRNALVRHGFIDATKDESNRYKYELLKELPTL